MYKASHDKTQMNQHKTHRYKSSTPSSAAPVELFITIHILIKSV